MRIPKAVRIGLWVVLGYIGLNLLALAGVNTYGKLAAPLYHWEIQQLAPEYRVEPFAFVRSSGLQQRLWQVSARNGVELFDANIRLWPIGSVECKGSALVISSLKVAVLVLLIPLLWPNSSWKLRAVSLVGAVPCLVVVEMCDIPLVLLGNLDRCFNRSSVFTAIGDVLTSGGDWALAVSGGVAAYGLGGWMLNVMPGFGKRSRDTLEKNKTTRRPAAAFAPPIEIMLPSKVGTLQLNVATLRRDSAENILSTHPPSQLWQPIVSYNLRVELEVST